MATLSLAFSLAFVLFLSTHSIIFRLFWCVVSSLCLGRQGILFPQNKPLRQPFPLRIHKTFHRENSSLSLSLSFAERCLFLPFSFLAEDIYIYIFFFSRCLDLPERRRERVGKIIIGETIRFFRYSFRAFIFRETLQFEKPET